MSLLLSVSKISKTMGSKQLFDELSFGIQERQRIGLLGPNGAGKSTLLKILSGHEEPDAGDVVRSKGIVLASVAQEESFDAGESILSIATNQLVQKGMDAATATVEAPIALTTVGFEDLEQSVDELSGGWKKRLSLAIAFAQDPDLLIMDEPTNHMDWDGILWLENHLKSFKKAFVLVSHDRAFLDRLCSRTMEINLMYQDGFLAFDCSYQEFLKKRQEYSESQLNLQDSLSNKARREVSWLRAGVKARTTKSQSRIKEAHQLLDNLDAVKQRNRSGNSKVQIEIEATGRLSKKLIELKDLTLAYGDNTLIEDLNLLLGPKTCIGLLGDNGCGKSSLLKAIVGQNKEFRGEIFKADKLKVVYFDQKREDLPQDVDLIHYLGDGSDYTIFKDESIHVASYASRFLFPSEKMKLKISQLSGGEQARLLIAKLLLQPADVLILDEPTNDLDIDSIEILEESLSQFSGLVLLVSHDRYFLSQLCDKFLAFAGNGDWQLYPDLSQWLKARGSATRNQNEFSKPAASVKSPSKKKVKLSYKEKRQLETIEKDIEEAELALAAAQTELEKPDVFQNSENMQRALKVVQEKQEAVEDLYRVWDEIESKQSGQD